MNRFKGLPATLAGSINRPRLVSGPKYSARLGLAGLVICALCLAACAGPKPPGPAEPGDGVDKLVLKDVRQLYVQNEQAGTLLVIIGRVVNEYDGPKSYIRLLAELYDDKGQVLAGKKIYPGDILSMNELKSLDQAGIEARLNDRSGIMRRNVDLKTGDSLPFVVVFYNAGSGVSEFGVKVVEGKDSPVNPPPDLPEEKEAELPEEPPVASIQEMLEIGMDNLSMAFEYLSLKNEREPSLRAVMDRAKTTVAPFSGPYRLHYVLDPDQGRIEVTVKGEGEGRTLYWTKP